MNNTTKLLISASLVGLFVIGWILWPRDASQDVRGPTELGGSTPAPSTPQPQENSGQANVQGAPILDREHQQLQSQLEELAKSQQYRDMIGRQDRGEQMTKEDLALIMKAVDIKGRMIKQPDIEKNTTYPPDDAKTQAMWEWWRKMKDAGPNFQYKRPIEFYGMVVDDVGDPIQGATVGVSIAGPDGDKRIRLESDGAGRFKIQNQNGKRIRVGVGKRGYSSSSQSAGYFEFAEFFAETFHEPDPNTPVVFVLPRLKP